MSRLVELKTRIVATCNDNVCCLSAIEFELTTKFWTWLWDKELDQVGSPVYTPTRTNPLMIFELGLTGHRLSRCGKIKPKCGTSWKLESLLSNQGTKVENKFHIFFFSYSVNVISRCILGDTSCFNLVSHTVMRKQSPNVNYV